MDPRVPEADPRDRGGQEHLRAGLLVTSVGVCPREKLRHQLERS